MEVLSLVKQALGVVSAASQKAASLSNTSSDIKSMHYATVDTEHPYKPASVKYFKVDLHTHTREVLAKGRVNIC